LVIESFSALRTAHLKVTVCPSPQIDNNAAGRAMRPIALGSKNRLQIGSDRGRRTAAVLLNVVQSCTELRAAPFAYRRDVLDRVSTHPASRIAELLPDTCTASQS
jgi:hypothetical protein